MGDSSKASASPTGSRDAQAAGDGTLRACAKNLRRNVGERWHGRPVHVFSRVHGQDARATSPTSLLSAHALRPGPLRWLVLALATGFGTGLSPVAPGTAGSLIGVFLFWYMAPPYGGWLAYVAATIVFIGVAIPVSTAAEEIYGKKDDGRIVIDEVVGFLVAMLWAPHNLRALAVGFLLFRFFDIVKPPPARKLQDLRGGTGIVIDDLLAGVYACLALHLLCLLTDPVRIWHWVAT